MMSDQAAVKRWLWLLAWLALFAVAAWLRLWQIGHQVLIDDEWHAVHKLMHSGYREIFLSFGHADHTIPLTLFFRLLADTVGLSDSAWPRCWSCHGWRDRGSSAVSPGCSPLCWRYHPC